MQNVRGDSSADFQALMSGIESPTGARAYSADEVFISWTNRGVLSVGEIAGCKIANPAGPVPHQTRELFDAYLNEYVSRRLTSAAR